MLKRKGAADVDDESKKAKPDAPTGESTEDQPDKPAVEESKAKTPDPKDDEEYKQIIITGPRKCGKSSLVVTFMDNQLLPSSHVDFLSKQYLHINPENNETTIIWDLDARKDYTGYRYESYKEADIALLCFSVKTPDSLEGSEYLLENLLYPWITELENHCENIPIILVGLKADLKLNSNLKFFSKDVIKKIMERYPKIVSYEEVSAYKNKMGVKKLFTSTIDCITNPKPKIMFNKCKNNCKTNVK